MAALEKAVADSRHARSHARFLRNRIYNRFPKAKEIEDLNAIIDLHITWTRAKNARTMYYAEGGIPVTRSRLYRLDTAVPDSVTVGHPFDLAVAVQPVEAPPLEVDELGRVRSAVAQVEWPKETTALTLRAAIHAPDCHILGQPFQMFRLRRGEESPVIFFSLQPRRAGSLPIRVTLYQHFLVLSSARLSVNVVELEAGVLVMSIASKGLVDLDRAEVDSDIEIYSLLTRAFSMDELHELYFIMGVDWDELPGTIKQRKASELLNYCQRRGMVDSLIERIIAARPNWMELVEE